MTCVRPLPMPRVVCCAPRAFDDGETMDAAPSFAVWAARNPDLGPPALLPGCPADGVPARLLGAIHAAVADETAPFEALVYVHSGMAPQDRNPMLVFLLHALENAGFDGLSTLSLRVPVGAPLPSEAHALAAALPSGGGLCLIIHDRINRLGRPGDIRDDGFALWAVTAPVVRPSAPLTHQPERNEDVLHIHERPAAYGPS